MVYISVHGPAGMAFVLLWVSHIFFGSFLYCVPLVTWVLDQFSFICNIESSGMVGRSIYQSIDNEYVPHEEL